MHEFLIRLPEQGVRVLRVDECTVTKEQIMQFACEQVQAKFPLFAEKLPLLYINSASRGEKFAPGEVIRVDWKLDGLLGGKGGFGAGLRAMGKKKGQNQPAQSFALCRDLQGNRLGALNAQAALKQAEETNSTHVTDQWLLERPTWAEPVKKKKHGDSASSAAAAAAAAKPKPAKDVDVFEVSFARELEANQRSTLEALQQGLQQQHNGNNKRAKVEEEETCSTYTQVSGKCAVKQTSAHSYLVTGKSDFATVAFPVHITAECVDALVLTNGLVQFGFMSQSSFKGDMEQSLDGVGDVPKSFAVDFARFLVLQNGTQADPISAADIQGKAVRVMKQSAQKYTFSVQDGAEREFATVECEDDRLVACISLEEDEAVEIRFVSLPPPKKPAAAPVLAATAQDQLDYSSISALESAGADRLKQELQSLGLKFGGTLQQRAQRLFAAHTSLNE